MKKIILPAFVALLLCSCSTNMYVSNTVNAPFLKEKGEIKVNADMSNLQTSAAVSDHIGIMLNGFYRNYEKHNNYEHKGGLIEAGIGYYKAMEEDPFVLEAFVGGGLGTVYKTESLSRGMESQTATFSARAVKLFVQPELGYTGKMFDIGFTPRFSVVKYTDFNSSNYTAEELDADYLGDDYINNRTFAFAEPAITVRAGYKWIKFQAQYGLTVNVGGGNIRHPPGFSSLGLVLDIAKWYND